MTGRLLAVLVFIPAFPAWAGSPWGAVRETHPGPAEVIGSYAAGCVAGGRALPLVGDGYQVMRPSRNRNYGHPSLIAYVERLGREVARRGWGRALVGDLAQPRGGPMDSGHRSHQSGLDVDIWLRLLPEGSQPLSREAREDTPMLSVVREGAAGLDEARWSPRYADLLRLAVADPRVDRVFVHPVIKQALCRTERERAWLRKVRPYWGHDAHFHVRLACPPDSPRCTPQDPVPAGDGCDEGLDRFVEELRSAARRPRPAAPPAPRKALPAACDAVLAGRPGPHLGAAGPAH